MKKILWILCLCLASTGYTFSQNNNTDQGSGDDVYYNDDNDNPPPTDASQQDAQQQDQGGGDVSYQQFYDQLGPYGSWVNYPGYGNCWVPAPGQVGPDFDPYVTGGHWVYTEYGWTWVSDYDWGWGPFHYGNWFDDPAYGWLWLPGYDWAPAWVIWGDYGGYYCWAPIGPGSVITAHYRPDARNWHFVPHDHILDGHLDHVAVRSDVAYHGDISELNSHINVISHAGTYGQSVFFAGPKAHDVEGYTHTKVARIAVNNTSKPGGTKIVNNQVNIYRPAIQRTNNQPSPKNVQNAQPRQSNDQRNNAPTQRNNTPAVRNNAPAPAQRSNPPAQPQRQSWTPPRQSAPAQPARQSNYIPSAPVEHYSAPAPAPHFSPPAGGGGGGFRGGGGGGGRR